MKKSTIHNLPKIERPREKLIAKGPQNLKDEELLAILLRTGTEGKNVLEVAKQILRKYSKKRILKMTYEDLIKIKGINSAILAAQELVKRTLEVREEILPTVKSIRDVIAQMSYLRDKTREHLAALYLSARNELVFKKHIFVGTLDANINHPREISCLNQSCQLSNFSPQPSLWRSSTLQSRPRKSPKDYNPPATLPFAFSKWAPSSKLAKS